MPTSNRPPTDELLKDWARLEGKPFTAIQSDSQTVCFNLGRTFDGSRTILYLINYGDSPVKDIRVTLNLPTPVSVLRLHAPGRATSDTGGFLAAGGWVVTVPEIDVFAVLEMQHRR